MLETKIIVKEAKICVLGLGYVGLPLVNLISEARYKCLGFDVNTELIEDLSCGKSHIEGIDSDTLQKNLDLDLRFSSKSSDLSDCDIFIICVPTPLDNHLNPDPSFVWKAVNAIKNNVKTSEFAIILESTTYVGHTEEIFEYLRENLPDKIIHIAFSPEREDPGNAKYKTKTIPKILGAKDLNAYSIIFQLYSQLFDKIVRVSTMEVAEFTKLYENTYRSINIGFVNEMKILADRLGLDIFEIIDAAKTKPFGFTAFYPGPGLGGHCIPIDPFYLNHSAKSVGMNAQFIELSGEINRNIPRFVVDKAMRILNENKKSISGSFIGIWGLSYKPGIDDLRESPSLELIKQLSILGAKLVCIDPYVKASAVDFRIISDATELSDQRFDLSIISTLHPDFTTDQIDICSEKILDTRGLYRELSERVWRA